MVARVVGWPELMVAREVGWPELMVAREVEWPELMVARVVQGGFMPRLIQGPGWLRACRGESPSRRGIDVLERKEFG